ncbi:MAG: cytochrome c [Deltaproteobacteria bacterium]|nr:cytochrome c [Deltaproteobacteria bacterium]
MFRSILPALALAALALPATAQAGGKELFGEQKCTKCHTVKSEGIAATEEKEKIVDLSGTGKDHDVAWFKSWLMKEAEMDSKVKKGEKVKHKQKFKGSPADLDAIAAWLKTLTK